MIKTAYYWWKFPTTFQLSEIKIWNMASRTNIFMKCQKWIFCCNNTHRLWIALQLKFSFQYVIQRIGIFSHYIENCGKSLKAKPNSYIISIYYIWPQSKKYWAKIGKMPSFFRILTQFCPKCIILYTCGDMPVWRNWNISYCPTQNQNPLINWFTFFKNTWSELYQFYNVTQFFKTCK